MATWWFMGIKKFKARQTICRANVFLKNVLKLTSCRNILWLDEYFEIGIWSWRKCFLNNLMNIIISACCGSGFFCYSWISYISQDAYQPQMECGSQWTDCDAYRNTCIWKNLNLIPTIWLATEGLKLEVHIISLLSRLFCGKEKKRANGGFPLKDVSSSDFAAKPHSLTSHICPKLCVCSFLPLNCIR